MLIAAGTVEPLGVPGAGLANFAGYVVWSGWLIAVAVAVLRSGRRTHAVAAFDVAASAVAAVTVAV